MSQNHGRLKLEPVPPVTLSYSVRLLTLVDCLFLPAGAGVPRDASGDPGRIPSLAAAGDVRGHGEAAGAAGRGHSRLRVSLATLD